MLNERITWGQKIIRIAYFPHAGSFSLALMTIFNRATIMVWDQYSADVGEHPIISLFLHRKACVHCKECQRPHLNAHGMTLNLVKLARYCTLKCSDELALFHTIRQIVFPLSSMQKWSVKASMAVFFFWLSSHEMVAVIYENAWWKLNFKGMGGNIRKILQLYPQVPAVEASLKVTIIRGDEPPVSLRLEEENTVRNKDTENHVQGWRFTTITGFKTKPARKGHRLWNLTMLQLMIITL